MTKGIDLPRDTALKILYDITEKGSYSNISVNNYLENSAFRGVDRAFITELVYGTIKWQLTIDFIISQFSSVKLKKISPWILNVLRLGVYQLLYTDRVPESAACNESVKLAKRYGHEASSRFVNGVLRNISRRRNEIKYPDREEDLIKFLSIRYSHPEWMVKSWVSRFGEEFTESLLAANNKTPEFTIRVNTLKTTKEDLVKRISSDGMEAAAGKYIDEALLIRNPMPLSEIEAYKDGLFLVQDESSMMAARVLDPKPGEFVVDVCSAPGGKSTHMAQLMENKGTIISRDVHEHKIDGINASAKRLGIDIIRAEVFDALRFDESLDKKADRVLVDAPCTGLGIIRRKPDIKWARDSSDKNEIIKLQKEILKSSSEYVKPGGFLVYSTCTVEREENHDIIQEFLKDNLDFHPVDFIDCLPRGLDKPEAKEGHIQVFPNTDGIDGFFTAKLRRD